MSSRAALVVIAIAAMLAATIAAQTTPATPPGSASSTTTASRFPPGPGRDALFKVCHDCHGPESVLGQLKTRDEWTKTLDEMAANGASGTDEEWTHLLEYLVKHYSLVFVNKAAASDLASTLDMPVAVAEAIVRLRSEKGTFKSLDELKQLPGVDAVKLEARKDRLVF